MAPRKQVAAGRRRANETTTPKAPGEPGPGPDNPAPLNAALHEARVKALLGEAPAPSTDTAGSSLDELVARTAHFFALSIDPRTRETYARRWAMFEQWCTERQLDCLPASPETVMLYLADSSRKGAALATIRGWCAAINRVHLEAGHRPPGADPAMSMFMRGIGRTTPPPERRQVSALRIGELRRLCRYLESLEVDEAQLRDRAILALSAHGLGDGEIARLDWSDVRFGASSVDIQIRAIRYRPQARDLVLPAAEHAASCPVDALSRWRAASGGRGPVFTGLARATVRGERLSRKAVYLVRRSRISTLGDPTSWPDNPMLFEVLSGPPSEVLRDKALLLLGFAGALRRVDVARLRWSDIRTTPDGLIVHLRRSKTDRAGRGADVGIPRGKSTLTCPVTALEAWRSRMQLVLGVEDLGDTPILVRVGRSGQLGKQPATPEVLTYMIQRRTEQAGLEGRWGGRSLRAGFISTAADLDIPLELIARQSRHADLDSLILYIRHDDPFRRNSASRLGM